MRARCFAQRHNDSRRLLAERTTGPGLPRLRRARSAERRGEWRGIPARHRRRCRASSRRRASTPSSTRPWVPIFVALIWILHPLLGVVALAGAVVLFLLSIANEFATRTAPRDRATAARSRLTCWPRRRSAMPRSCRPCTCCRPWPRAGPASTARCSTAAPGRATSATPFSPPRSSCASSCRSRSWASAAGW